jgi:transposase
MPKAPGVKYITPELRAIIWQNAQDGLQTEEIARFTNISKRAIQKIVKRYKERGHHENAPKVGRPRRLNERAIRHLQIHLEKDRHQSLSDITDFVNNFAEPRVSIDTIQRVLERDLDMHARISAPKPFLKDTHKRARLAWAREHQTWGPADWRCVIWTDEASVEIGKSSRVNWVWRRPGERDLDKCLTPTFKSGRQSLMIWGCIAYGKRGPLIRIPKDSRKGSDYVRLVLGGPLWDFYKEIYEEKGLATVMEDGAPVHTCKLAKEWRAAHQILAFPHPAQSPDLNPIENIWYALKIAINKRPVIPRNVDALWTAIQEEWAKIDTELIDRLVESMPKRARAVWEVKGGHTKY